MISPAPGALPVIGHALPILRDPFRFLTTLPDDAGLVDVRVGPFKTILVRDPELVLQLLRDDATFDKGGPLYEQGRDLLGDGLLTCPHAMHRRKRRLTQPAFHSSRMPSYAGTMTARIDALTMGWRDGQTLDVLAQMESLTLGVIAETMFSKSLSPQTLDRAVADFYAMHKNVYLRALLPSVLSRVPTPGNRHYHQARRRLRHTIEGVIRERRTSDTDHGDLLSALLSAQDTDSAGDRLTETEIFDQVITFFLVGAETTACALAWALFLLSSHPETEDRLRAEAGAVLADGPARLEHIPHLPLARQVLNEALRLYPPGWIMTRTVVTDATLGGHTIPAGSTVVLSPYTVQRRGDLFPDPDHFDPHRWDPQSPRPAKGAYLPFGSGARTCIGEQFALTEAVLAVATIVHRWQLRPTDDRPVRPANAGTLRPRRLRMRATRYH